MLQYQIDRIEHQVAEDRAQSGVFLIGPLERGQATTLGNALRRVLMGAGRQCCHRHPDCRCQSRIRHGSWGP